MNEPKRTISSTSPQPLTARRLTVTRGERILFANLDFSVASGEVLLLRGPNGVGKSTLLLALAGIVRPDAGSIDGAAATDIHLLGYQSGLKPRLTVAENLGFWRDLYGNSGTPLDTALEHVGIAQLAPLETGYLSSGQLRRLSLARLLVSPRPIWLLDEPSATLDADGETLLATLIDEHRSTGGITIVATHHDLRLADSSGVETLTLGGAA
ncbi:MAG: heme ABC exporter ATP-binding protein CcmA [Devosia sp.]